MTRSPTLPKKLIVSIKYIVLSCYAVTTLYPLVWVFLTSLKADSEVYGNPFGLPRAWKFSNFKTVWETMKLYIYMTNSVLYTCCALFIILLITSMAAYVLARTMKSRRLSLYFTISFALKMLITLDLMKG